MIIQANDTQKQAQVSMLMLDNADFMPKLEGISKRSLHINKGENSSRIYNNYKYVYQHCTTS
jgi:hypothetical protein